MNSHLENLGVPELMALTFLMEDGRSPEALREDLPAGDFRERWRKAEERLQRLIRYYPDEAEEKHYFIANLDAVHGIDPYAEETKALIERFKPLIQFVLQGVSS